jgi:adenine-specific DNA-methyltransferase
MASPKRPRPTAPAEPYRHPESTSLMRPEVGTQAQFKKRKPPKEYRYDASLSPALEWDERPAREEGERYLRQIQEAGSFGPLKDAVEALRAAIGTAKTGGEKARQDAERRALEILRATPVDAVEEALRRLGRAEEAARKLAAMSRPFLDWAGKAERLSFDVPTLPLFVHERLGTQAILETLKGHALDKQTGFQFFGDPQHPIRDQMFEMYEHRTDWVNRMILGDSLVVMSSLLAYEGMGGQVQMIYMDPPYGISFGSNFQPFVRKREVKHGDDLEMTREPEVVQAYRDTWELGLHSYLTYLRDRLLLCRDLLHPTGSIFLQIGEENVHHVREVMDEVFGEDHLVRQIIIQKAGSVRASRLSSVADYLLWYAKDIEQVRSRTLFRKRSDEAARGLGDRYNFVESPTGKTRRPVSAEEQELPAMIPKGWRRLQLVSLTTGSAGGGDTAPLTFEGKVYHPGAGRCWKTTIQGFERLVQLNRIEKRGDAIFYVRYLDDFPVHEITNVWDDLTYVPDSLYVVQTNTSVINYGSW